MTWLSLQSNDQHTLIYFLIEDNSYLTQHPIVQVFDIKAHYPELFSRLPGNPDDVTDIFARGEHALGRYNLGSLNVTRPSDLILLAELELIQEMIDAVSSLSCRKFAHRNKCIP